MHTHPFGVTVRDHTIDVRGDVDLVAAPQLTDAITALARSTDHPTVVLDLATLTFMDSTGINALIRAHQALEGMGKELEILRVPPPVHRAFELVGVVDYLNVRSTDPLSS